MKKQKMMMLALIGMLAGGCSSAQGDSMSSDMQTFYEQLSPDAQQKFMQLDKQHKQMAMDVVQQGCKAAHECKGIREKAVEEQYNAQMQGQK